MPPDDVVDAIRRVVAGEMVVAPAMTTKMIGILQNGKLEHDNKCSLKSLTERETQILELLAHGESNKGIARTLGISNDTVKQHVRHILTKLNLTSRVEAAVMFAVEHKGTEERYTSSG
jgi:two-component system nitrate/nitrite response regulator NarL